MPAGTGYTRTVSEHPPPEIVALIPAAGRGSRLGSLPCSKEILPLPADAGEGPPITALDLLLDGLALAGVGRALLLLRPEKRDIPAHLARRAGLPPQLEYVEVAATPSVPHTLDAAYPLVREARVALGFPDILFRPQDAFQQILDRLRATKADAVIGLVETELPEQADMVELDPDGGIRRLAIKEGRTDLRYTWAVAAWTPRFTDYLHAFVARLEGTDGADHPAPEPYVGDVLRRALADGLSVVALPLPGGRCLDVGTPQGRARAAAWLAADAPGPPSP